MLAQVSIVPLGVGVSVSSYIADALSEIEKSGLDYRLTAMGTVIEGNWDEVVWVLKTIHDRALDKAERVLMNISLDDRKDKPVKIDAKIKAVENILGKTLKK